MGAGTSAHGGSITINGGLGSDTGNGGSVVVSSGSSTNGDSGHVSLSTFNGGVTSGAVSGNVDVFTGDSSHGSSGSITVSSGDAANTSSDSGSGGVIVLEISATM